VGGCQRRNHRGHRLSAQQHWQGLAQEQQWAPSRWVARQ
jgi:hypothetical protein